ncbi:MAG: TlpA family protein disulfide reductase [Bacteriovoracaceae bacterium]|nr:TlpA family protein disulfide reductase [Bacteriovoracaceae bacterium]
MSLINKSNVFTFAIFAVLIWRQFPVILNNFQPIFHPSNILEVEFPPLNQKAVTIFWATWCGPCKVEMNRLKKSILNKKILSEKVYAINPFEEVSVIKDFLKKNEYPFIFIDAPAIAKKLNIQVTPTTLFVENGKVTTLGSGMSLIGIWRAEWFLDSN